MVGDKYLGMLEAVGEVFPEAKFQRCTVHFYHNVFSVTPHAKGKLVAKMLKAIDAQESYKEGGDSIEETLTYCDFPSEHWTCIRTNTVIECLNQGICRRTRLVGGIPDGNSALMLVCARLCHVSSTQLGNKKYMNMRYLEIAAENTSITG